MSEVSKPTMSPRRRQWMRERYERKAIERRYVGQNPGRRPTVLLSDVEDMLCQGYSYLQVAEQLGCSYWAVARAAHKLGIQISKLSEL